MLTTLNASAPTEAPDRSSTAPLWVMVFAAIVFAGLSTWGSVVSDGFVEADSCTHYAYARGAIEQPRYLLDIWGRPLCTGLYALPAAIGGRIGAHVMSLALALLLAWLTACIARRQWGSSEGDEERRRSSDCLPALAFIFTLGQPLIFFHSFAVLTELPFAVMLALAFWMFQRRQWLTLAIITGFMPLARPEGFGFILLAAAALLVFRRAWWLPVLILPLALWSYAGWYFAPSPPNYPWWAWLKHAWPYSAESVYAHGGPFHFLLLLPAIVSPFVFPAMCLGIWCICSNLGRKRFKSEPAATRSSSENSLVATACSYLVVILPLGILIGHSLLYWRGKMASSGEPRYMMVVAPFWALLAARGWQRAWRRVSLRRPLMWASVAVLIPLGPCLWMHIIPMRLQGDWAAVRDFLAWYERSPLERQYPALLSSHPYLFLYDKEHPRGSIHFPEWSRANIDHPKPGTILLWDPIYSSANSDANRVVTLPRIAAAGWMEERALDQRLNRDSDAHGGLVWSPTSEKEWHVFLSPQDSHGGVPASQSLAK